HHTLVDAVLSHWDGDDKPDVVEVTFDQLHNDKSTLENAGVAWVIIGQDAKVGLYTAIERLQDQHIPTVLTREGQRGSAGTVYHDGVIIGPHDAPPQVLC